MSRVIAYGSSSRIVDVNAGQGSLESLAQDVAIHRGQAVTEAMFHMAAIRSLQTRPETGTQAIVTCGRASVQLSTAQEGQQAAHLLPGQIRVGSFLVWQLATHPDRKIASEVVRLEKTTEQCFGLVNVLPAAFNKADSEAEGRGGESAADRLKPLFGAVVQTLWRTAVVDPARPLTIDRKATLAALGSWFQQITSVYQDAARRKALRGYPDEARVLTTYADSFRVANPGRFVAANVAQILARYPSLS
jgi:hypothetical protein